MEKKEKIPCWQKVNLTIQEAAEYSNIGQTTIRELLKQKNCNFCTSQQKVDTFFIFYTLKTEHSTPYIVLVSNSLMSMQVFLH